MENQTMVRQICPTSTRVAIKKGALLVDVREKKEVELLSFDVPAIVNIPLSEFEERYNEIPIDREVVLVCTDGSKSIRATGFLVNHGYTLAVHMKQGLVKWVHKGFPVKGDASSLDQEHSCCSGSSSGCC